MSAAPKFKIGDACLYQGTSDDIHNGKRVVIVDRAVGGFWDWFVRATPDGPTFAAFTSELTKTRRGSP